MSLEICSLHQQIKDLICAKNQCNQLKCKQCFQTHSLIYPHQVAVRLNLESKQYFLRWTQFILQKLHSFSQIVTHMGYSKVFQMKLQTSHPKGTVSQLSFQQIQKVTMDALQQHKKITQGNLAFIKSTQFISQMVHPQFLKDLYNIVCQEATFNLQNLPNNIQKKLMKEYAEKQIYRFAKFHILPKQINQIEQERKKLLRQFQDKILVRVVFDKNNQALNKQAISNVESKEIGQKLRSNQFSNPQTSGFSKDYHTSSQYKIPQVQLQQQPYKELTRRIFLYEQQTSALRSKQLINTKKIAELQIKLSSYDSQTVNLENKIQQLQSINKNLLKQNADLKANLLQKQNQKTFSSASQDKVVKYISGQEQQKISSQIKQFEQGQIRLIEQNRQLNIALKNIENIAQGRSRKIEELQEQIKKMLQNIKLKEKSIQQLNQLISNEEEEINYRQNEAQILGQQIKKLLNKIKSLQDSIRQLNKLIMNEEQEISYRQNQVQTLESEIKKLMSRIQELQNSIKSLNSLIANEQQEISYRENETQILEKEVKKLLQKISYLERSIHQLNNLISNQEEQIAYRENQSQTLAQQVKNLIRKNQILSRSIRQLNNLIANQQQQISYRQNEAQTLTAEVKKLIQRNASLQTQLTQLSASLQKHLNQRNTSFQTQLAQVRQQLQLTKHTLRQTENNLSQTEANIRQTKTSLRQSQNSISNNSMTANQQLIEQVVLLQADLQIKNDDLQILTSIVQDYILKLLKSSVNSTQQKTKTINRLQNLKTIQLQIQ